MDGSKVYLDYNSTTPLEPEVHSTITEALTVCFANPSSSHEEGVRAKQCIDKARSHVAAMIGAKDSDIIFTSGCTEANNMVIHSCVTHFRRLMKQEGSINTLPHIVTSNLEHGSVSKTTQNLADDGEIELTVIKANPSCGQVLVEDIIGAIKPNTILVTIMLANNETGVVQPVKEISSALATLRKEQKHTYPFLHTDSAQACGKIPVSISELDIDYLSIAGQKFYGPRMGALYVRDLENKTVPLYPFIFGAGQERGYRSGYAILCPEISTALEFLNYSTENTAYMAGLGKASELVCNNLNTYHKQMKEVRDYLEKQLSEHFGDGVHFNGKFPGIERIPNTCNVSLIGEQLQGWKVLNHLQHSMASTGAACHSKSAKPSETLLCSGVPEDIARNALRLSVGRNTSKEDIDIFIADLKQAVNSIESEC